MAALRTWNVEVPLVLQFQADPDGGYWSWLDRKEELLKGVYSAARVESEWTIVDKTARVERMQPVAIDANEQPFRKHLEPEAPAYLPEWYVEIVVPPWLRNLVDLPAYLSFNLYVSTQPLVDLDEKDFSIELDISSILRNAVLSNSLARRLGDGLAYYRIVAWGFVNVVEDLVGFKCKFRTHSHTTVWPDYSIHVHAIVACGVTHLSPAKLPPAEDSNDIPTLAESIGPVTVVDGFELLG